MRKNKKSITKEQVEQHELLVPLLRSAYDEVRELSKKKPDGPLNAFKVEFINKILAPLKELLSNETTNLYLVVLDKDTLPSNSDAVMILSYYLQATDMFINKYMVSTEINFDDEFPIKKWNIVED